MNKQFIISAPNSNAGKTTVTLGLLRLLKQKGFKTQPFKVGPDYIDPKFHKLASGKTGVNLDLFMMDEKELHKSLVTYGSDTDVNCIEGVMGLFDGAKRAEGSTAHLAKKTDTPVLLVVDAKAVAYSVAPLIQGFKNFDKNVTILGVIFNRVGSKRHYAFLKEACDDIGVTSFGYLKNLKNIDIPSRHLGLNIQEIEQFNSTIDCIASEMEQTVAWKEILNQSKQIPPIAVHSEKTKPVTNIKFAVAKDEAFNFIYPQTIEAMKQLGVVEFFSPIRDSALPVADFVYIPGGYPECYLDELCNNHKMIESIKEYATSGGKIYAECGGMMYLGKSIVNTKGTAFSTVGIFDFSSSINTPKLHLGYRTVKLNNVTFKGHEFHYSSLINNHEKGIESTVKNARLQTIETIIYKKNKVLASYLHLYLGSTKQLIEINNELL